MTTEEEDERDFQEWNAVPLYSHNSKKPQKECPLCAAKTAWLASRRTLREKEYILMDEYSGKKIRGPFSNAETASAVRNELENRFPDKEWNLQIIEVKKGN